MSELDPQGTTVDPQVAEGAGAAPSPARYQQELARSLTMRENILITLSSVTPASSVFIIVPAILLAVGGASVLTMVLAAVAAVFVGLCYAELSATYPVAGGEYTWAARLLGRPLGFATFLLTMVSGVLIIAVIALGTGAYLGAAWSALSGTWVGVVVIGLTAVVAALDIRTNAWITGVFLAIELLALVVLTGLGVFHPERGLDALFSAQTFVGHGLHGVGASAIVTMLPVALFAFNGYGAAVYYVEETKDANRTIGRVILVSLVVTALVEIVPLAAVVVGAPDLKTLLSSDAPMNDFLIARGGHALNTVISVGIALAIINAVIAITIQIARLLYASARDRSWPGPVDDVLGKVHPASEVPGERHPAGRRTRHAGRGVHPAGLADHRDRRLRRRRLPGRRGMRAATASYRSSRVAWLPDAAVAAAATAPDRGHGLRLLDRRPGHALAARGQPVHDGGRDPLLLRLHPPPSRGEVDVARSGGRGRIG